MLSYVSECCSLDEEYNTAYPLATIMDLGNNLRALMKMLSRRRRVSDLWLSLDELDHDTYLDRP